MNTGVGLVLDLDWFGADSCVKVVLWVCVVSAVGRGCDTFCFMNPEFASVWLAPDAKNCCCIPNGGRKPNSDDPMASHLSSYSTQISSLGNSTPLSGPSIKPTR